MSDKGKGKYEELGVSHSKEDVHKAIKNMDKGIYPSAFCKILPDVSGDPEFCSIFHSDSAGTKSIIAYMMYKETGKLDYFKGIVQDAIVMNVDDVLCVGVDGNSLISDTIGRNKKLISGEAIALLIKENELFTKKLSDLGFNINLAGGETEDIGDLIQTFEVGCSLFARIPRKKVIAADKIEPGDVIIGLASFGQANYEDSYNSGIGSNGLTLARHGTLSHKYYNKYPECVNRNLDEKVTFFGKHDLLEPLDGTSINIGEALLSPTRSFAPIMVKVFQKYREKVHAVFHNTGGGQTKCLNFGKNLKYIKNNMFKTPPLYKIIQNSSGTDWKEMYQVFNMGHRMEIIVPEEILNDIIKISENFNVKAQKIGYIEENKSGKGNIAIIESENGTYEYFSKTFE
ncbi:MAG: phosphoribosylformylglycinamidine cyclo-ligase [archaeon]|nr:phosphoribosylformylglycinamidine cyclo-ligase [archaeon]